MALGPEVYPKFSQISRTVKDFIFHSYVFLKLEREKHWELSSLRLMHADFILDRQPKLSLLLMWRVFSACTLESFGISIYQYPQQYPQHGPSHMWQGIILHFHTLSIFMVYAFQCLIHHVPLFISLVLEFSGCQGLMNQKTGNLTWHISYRYILFIHKENQSAMSFPAVSCVGSVPSSPWGCPQLFPRHCIIFPDTFVNFTAIF